MIREITKSDIPKITLLCREAMPHDHFFDSLIEEKTIASVDYEPDLNIVDEENGIIRGFAVAGRGLRKEKSWAWIRLMAVHPDFRCKGIGSAIIDEIEKRLKSKKCEGISIMDCPKNYFMPGLYFKYTEGHCFLLKKGYKKSGDNINLICKVWRNRFDCDKEIESLKQEGFFIKRAEEKDKEIIFEFLKKEFPAWTIEVENAYKNNPISTYICLYEGKCVGFSNYEGNNKGTGWFGPMGVLPITRGKGIGAVLCKLCLNGIADLGFGNAIIPWVGPIRFYSKVCDSNIDRIFWTYEKLL